LLFRQRFGWLAAATLMPDKAVLRKIVDQFAGPRTRLLVTGSDRAARPAVEVAHEALIRTWPHLRHLPVG